MVHVDLCLPVFLEFPLTINLACINVKCYYKSSKCNCKMLDGCWSSSMVGGVVIGKQPVELCSNPSLDVKISCVR